MSNYSIAAVSKLTGVGCHTLRVWERRYGFPTPDRSPSGQRRYSAEVVETLRVVSRVVREGQPIGQVIGQLKTGKLPLVGQSTPEVSPFGRPATCATANLDEPLGQFVELIRNGDGPAASQLLEEWDESHSIYETITQLIHPALVEVGEQWFRGSLEVYHERLATALLHRRLDALLVRAKHENTEPKGIALLCSIQGDRHEGGVRVVAPLLELAGWRIECLGVDLPVKILARAVESWNPAAIGVSFVLSRNINKRFQELQSIKRVPVFVGGRSLTNYQTLARRHGLIPLGNDLSQLGDAWQREVDLWHDRREFGQNGTRCEPVSAEAE